MQTYSYADSLGASRYVPLLRIPAECQYGSSLTETFRSLIPMSPLSYSARFSANALSQLQHTSAFPSVLPIAMNIGKIRETDKFQILKS